MFNLYKWILIYLATDTWIYSIHKLKHHIHSLWCASQFGSRDPNGTFKSDSSSGSPWLQKLKGWLPGILKQDEHWRIHPGKLSAWNLKNHPFETGKLNLPSTSMTLGWIVDFLECNFSFSPFLWRFCHPYPSFQDTNLCAIHAKRVTIMPKAFGGPEWQNRCNNCNLKLL